MLKSKKIDPKILILIAMLIVYILNIFRINVFCMQYQIIECPSEINLNTYIVEAETNEEAHHKINDILEANNLNKDNYEIMIEETNIKIRKIQSLTIGKDITFIFTNGEFEDTLIEQEKIESNTFEKMFEEIDKMLSQKYRAFSYRVYKLSPTTGKRMDQIQRLDNTGMFGENFLKIEIETYNCVEIGGGENIDLGGVENEIKQLQKINISICIIICISFIYSISCSLLGRRK